MAVLSGCNPDRLPPTPEEVDRPLLAQTDVVSPGSEAIRVDADTDVRIRFNEPMDPTSFEGHLLLKTPDGQAVSGSYVAEGSEVVLRPAAALATARLHQVELRGRVRDAHGNTIELNGQPVLDDTTLIYRSWFFTSGDYDAGAEPKSYVLDTRGRLWTVSGFVEETGRITRGLGAAPKGLVRSGDRIAVLNPTARKAVFFEAASGDSVGSAAVAQDPVALAASGGTLYVVSAQGKAVTRIRVSDGSAQGTLPLGFFPGTIAMAPDGSTLFTLDQVTGNLVAVDPQSGATRVAAARLVRIPITGEMSVHPSTGEVFVADTRSGKVHVMAPDGSGPVRSYGPVSATWKPFKLVFSGEELFVSNQNATDLVLLNTATGETVGTYSFDAPVKGLEVLPGGNPILVLSGVRLLLVDVESGMILRAVDLPDSNAESVLTVN